MNKKTSSLETGETEQKKKENIFFLELISALKRR